MWVNSFVGEGGSSELVKLISETRSSSFFVLMTIESNPDKLLRL